LRGELAQRRIRGRSSRGKRDTLWRRYRRRPAGMFGLVLMCALFLMAAGADLIAPYNPFALSDDVLLPPSPLHLLGTNDVGGDIFSAVVHGARVSLLVGLASTALSTLIGVVIGGAAGFFGGIVDDLLMRFTELFQVLPRFFLALIVVALLGSNIWLIVLLLGLTLWTGTARLLRAQVLSLRTRDYVLAARMIGVAEHVILLRHVLPGALPPVITHSALQVGSAILLEASLSFLGMGDRNVVSWGLLLNDAQQFVRQAWWMSMFPGLAITITVLALNLVADGLNEAWNPRL
jgi:peptide/nickel transport system permease protein